MQRSVSNSPNRARLGGTPSDEGGVAPTRHPSLPVRRAKARPSTVKPTFLPTAILAIAAVLWTSFVFATPASDPCIPDGGSATEDFNRPPINSVGMPTSAEWTGGDGDPEAYDVDAWSAPDDMGAGTSSANGDTASVDVHNTGGNIIGPNGAVVEGGLEGDCVEIVMVWHFKYKATISVCVSANVGLSVEGKFGGTIGGEVGGEVGRERCTEIEIWLDGVVADGPKEVCPC